MATVSIEWSSTRLRTADALAIAALVDNARADAPAAAPSTAAAPADATAPSAAAPPKSEPRALGHFALAARTARTSTDARAPWGLVHPLQLASLAGYGCEVARVLTASSALAHDPDLLYALLVPARRRRVSPAPTSELTYAFATVPLLHAAAALGRSERVRELLAAAAPDGALLAKRDAKGRTPIIAAAAAGEPRTLELLLADPRAFPELVAAEAIDVAVGDGAVATAFIAACEAAQYKVRRLAQLFGEAEREALGARLASSAAGGPAPAPAPIDASAIMRSTFERLVTAARATERWPRESGAVECARMLVATGAVDPAAKTGCGSGMMELAAAPARAAVIRGARPTQLTWAVQGSSAIREAVAETMLADLRCSREAIAAHWLMGRPSAFWRVAEAFGVVNEGMDCGEPQPRHLAHDVAWWKRVLAEGPEGEAARAELAKDDRVRLHAHGLLRAMMQRLLPSTEVVRRPFGPFYDESDGPGWPMTAEEVAEGLDLGKLAQLEWAAE